jgi:arginyl-tRNA synthetase
MDEINDILKNSFTSLGYNQEHAFVNISNRPDISDFQCNAALKLAKEVGKNPREIAEQITEKLSADKAADLMFDKITIDGPGFINFTLSNAYLETTFKSINKETDFDAKSFSRNNKVVLDYGGPNVAKDLHVGHLRTAVIGESIKRIMQFLGDTVISDVHLGDWGLPMGMIIEGIRKRYPDLPYFDESFTGEFPEESPVTIEELNAIYPEQSKLCKEDEEEYKKAKRATKELQSGRIGYVKLWRHFTNVSISGIREIYDRLGVTFDYWYGESKVHDVALRMNDNLRGKGLLEKSEGAEVIKVKRKDDNKEVPPLIIVNSEGAFTYATSDLATIYDRKEEFDPDKILYVVDQRQSLHFEQVFRAAERAQYFRQEDLEHLPVGTVNGLDGKPFKTRSGDTVKLNDFIDTVIENAAEKVAKSSKLFKNEFDNVASKVGISAIVFGDLQNHRSGAYIFDVDKMTSFEGKTGPYILYTAVRIKSILEKASGGKATSDIKILSDEERQLILQILNFSYSLNEAYIKRAPNIICDFLYDFCQGINNFYHKYKIITEKNSSVKNSRLSLLEKSLSLIELISHLLLIQIPERM